MVQSLSANKEQDRVKSGFWGTDFWFLLLYSLLPGIYKILGNQLLMLGCLPIIVYMLYRWRSEIRIYKIDTIFLLLIIYLGLQSVAWMLFPNVNKTGIAMGIFMDIIPMAGYVLAKGMDFKYFAQVLIRVIFVHCIIGIILYPPFRITSASNPIVNTLVEGVAFGRMASVSGSLGFGNLLMTGFILSFFFARRYLPLMLICLIFSAQRSAWVGGFFVLIVYVLGLLKNFKLAKVFSFILVAIVLVLGIFWFVDSILGIDLGFITSRFSELTTAGSERDFLWKAGIDNFKSYPLGVGVGQVGQIASRADGAESAFALVPDGDYFRVLSEFGIVGGLYYAITLFFFFLILLFVKLTTISQQAIVALMGGNLIQMIGSNVSEFYFTNFIYWIVFGYFFILVGKVISFKRFQST